MSSPMPMEIDCQGVKARFDQEADMVLIDCRESDEHALVRIPGAILLPMSQIAERAAELEAYRERHVVVHCHHGGRSMRVAMWLRGQGYERVQSMAGGIDAWATDIDPTLPRY